MFAATFALAISDAWEFGVAALGVCPAASAGTSINAGMNDRIRFMLSPE